MQNDPQEGRPHSQIPPPYTALEEKAIRAMLNTHDMERWYRNEP